MSTERILYYSEGSAMTAPGPRVSVWEDANSPDINNTACKNTIFWVEYVTPDLPDDVWKVPTKAIEVGDTVIFKSVANPHDYQVLATFEFRGETYLSVVPSRPRAAIPITVSLKEVEVR